MFFFVHYYSHFAAGLESYAYLEARRLITTRNLLMAS
jgi:hypothetical protein